VLSPPVVHSYHPYQYYEGSSPPLDIPLPSLQRFQSFPSRSGTSLSTTSWLMKRKRGKPKYESRSLPSEVGASIHLHVRTVRTLSATERAAASNN